MSKRRFYATENGHYETMISLQVSYDRETGQPEEYRININHLAAAELGIEEGQRFILWYDDETRRVDLEPLQPGEKGGAVQLLAQSRNVRQPNLYLPAKGLLNFADLCYEHGETLEWGGGEGRIWFVLPESHRQRHNNKER